MNKSILTNLISVTITFYGLISPVYSTEIFMAGLFALSGGLTNWIAIHMLFEKVPFLYGSGVIPNRFEDFKNGIKNLIMNQKVVVGIGNIYATEALFLSGIRPSRKCHRLTKIELTKLIKAIKSTLRNAIKAGGTSIKDFKNLEGELGYFAQKLNIYGLKKCKRCKSDTSNIVIAGRSSYFCKKCQK